MRRFYRLIAYSFILIFVFFNIFIFVFAQDISNYLNAVNKISDKNYLSGPTPKETFSGGGLELTMINDPKFKKLEKYSVDLKNVNLSLATTTTIKTAPAATTTKSSEITPNFPTGNTNPFK